MNRNTDPIIDYVYINHKKGFLGKSVTQKLILHGSYIDGEGFGVLEDEVGTELIPFEIKYANIESVYTDNTLGKGSLVIRYKSQESISGSLGIICFLSVDNPDQWIEKILSLKDISDSKELAKAQLYKERAQEEERALIQKEEAAAKFFTECFQFHIHENTPTFKMMEEKNKVALIYLDDVKNLHFLKIDGYEEEENDGLIIYDNIHYYEKAGSVHYTTDINGHYSSFGGSFTGASFSKFAAVGGGLLFGLMGMAIGAALTYKPAKQTPSTTTFNIDSNVRKIDDRSVILNFYSEAKKQYIDIELAQETYNFFQTYLPEKKYGIVEELEKKTAVHMSSDLIESGKLLKGPANQLDKRITDKGVSSDPIDEIRKYKSLFDEGIITQEEFEAKKKQLLGI